jgi:hypothetical protein
VTSYVHIPVPLRPWERVRERADLARADSGPLSRPRERVRERADLASRELVDGQAE